MFEEWYKLGSRCDNNIVSRSVKLALCFDDSNCELDGYVQKDIFHNIVSLYIRVRSFSFAKDIVQQYKIKAKQRKSKSL